MAVWWSITSFFVYISLVAFMSGYGVPALVLFGISCGGVIPLKLGVEEMAEKEMK